MSTIVACPHCGKSVEWNNAAQWRPFCSRRCRLIDLGEWMREERRIPAESSPDLIDEPAAGSEEST